MRNASKTAGLILPDPSAEIIHTLLALTATSFAHRASFLNSLALHQYVGPSSGVGVTHHGKQSALLEVRVELHESGFCSSLSHHKTTEPQRDACRN